MYIKCFGASLRLQRLVRLKFYQGVAMICGMKDNELFIISLLHQITLFYDPFSAETTCLCMHSTGSTGGSPVLQ